MEGSPGIRRMHLELTYDPGLLAVESVEPGSLVAGNALTAFNVDEPGRIVISLAASKRSPATAPWPWPLSGQWRQRADQRPGSSILRPGTKRL